jgi:murein DD-endopeptidase MepM/ murein hydrolase activator NlpD
MVRPTKGSITYRFGVWHNLYYVKNPDGTVFGWRHHGTDYGVPVGTKVIAPSKGTVTYVGYAGTAGNMVVIVNGVDRHRLLHLSKFSVKKGQVIKEGQLIGYSGKTGFTLGAHLHWDMARRGKYVNGEAYIGVVNAPVYHTVRAGEYLSLIAGKYSTTWQNLVALNKSKYPSLVKNPNAINIGWVLRVK